MHGWVGLSLHGQGPHFPHGPPWDCLSFCGFPNLYPAGQWSVRTGEWGTSDQALWRCLLF